MRFRIRITQEPKGEEVKSRDKVLPDKCIMEARIHSRILKVSINIIISVFLFLVIRSISRGIGIPGPVGELIRLALFTVSAYFYVRFLAKRSGLNIAECYISSPAINRTGIIIGILLPCAFVFASTRLPGTLVSGQLSSEYFLAVIIPLLIDTGVGSGINEELFFRGVLLKTMEQNFGRRIAVIISSSVFGTLHLLNGSLSFWEMVAFWGFTTSMGILFSVLTIKSGNIWNGVVVHGLTNMCGVMISLGENTEFTSPFTYYFSKNFPGGMSGEQLSVLVLNTIIVWVFIIILCRSREGEELTNNRGGGDI